MRTFAKIPPSEVRNAVDKLAKELDIEGRIIGCYNLYEAVLEEHRRRTRLGCVFWNRGGLSRSPCLVG